MWYKASDIAQHSIIKSGNGPLVEAEKILALSNKIGKNQYKAVSFRQGLLVIAALDADPIVLLAEHQKIKNTLNLILKQQLIQKVKIIPS